MWMVFWSFHIKWFNGADNMHKSNCLRYEIHIENLKDCGPIMESLHMSWSEFVCVLMKQCNSMQMWNQCCVELLLHIINGLFNKRFFDSILYFFKNVNLIILHRIIEGIAHFFYLELSFIQNWEGDKLLWTLKSTINC
jgi:hypothetical protein